jgi:superoxide reductase
MHELGQHIQKADWKKEKHVPVIEAPEKVAPGELFQVKVTLGKEIAHPNTTEHHIRWIVLYYWAAGEKFTYEVARFEFAAHGESVDGANKGPVYTHHEGVATVKITKPGVLHALALCNIHGLWESSRDIGLA